MSKVKKIATLSLGQGINVLVNFLFLPYMARVFSYEDYGTYGQVLLVTSFLAALLSFGLPQIIYVYLNQDRDRKVVFSSNLLAAFGLASIGAILLFASSSLISAWLSNDRLAFYLKIYSFALVLELPFQVINSYFIYHDKVKLSVKIAVITNLFKVLLVVYVIQVYHSLTLAFIAILISQVIRLITGLVNVKDFVFLKYEGFKLSFEQIKKGFPLGLTGLLGAGILYIDGIMVSKFEGVQSFAIYRNGAIEVPFIATIYGSIAAIVLPEISKLFAKRKFSEIITLKKKVIMNTMVLTYPVLVFLLFNSSDIIQVYLGEKYQASAIVFAIFNLTILMRVNDYHDVLIAANKSKTILYSYVFVFVLNVVLNYFLITQFGIIGAAISTVISLFVFAYILMRQSMKVIEAKFHELFNVLGVIKLLGSSIFLSIILYFLTRNVTSDFLKLSVFAVLYFPLIYYFLYRSNLMSSVVVNNFLNKIFRRNK